MCKFSATVAFDTATNRYTTRDEVNTYVNVTFEDLFSNAPTLAKIEFSDSLILSAIWSPVGTQQVQPWRRVGLGR